jgi:hypothetical protein
VLLVDDDFRPTDGDIGDLFEDTATKEGKRFLKWKECEGELEESGESETFTATEEETNTEKKTGVRKNKVAEKATEKLTVKRGRKRAASEDSDGDTYNAEQGEQSTKKGQIDDEEGYDSTNELYKE